LRRIGATDGRGILTFGLFGDKMTGLNEGDNAGGLLGNELGAELDERLGKDLGVVLD
jgi:hypothetical protein